MKNKFLIFGVIIAVLFLALLDSNSNSNTDLTSTASLSPTSSESQNDFENKVQPKNPDEELNSYQVVDDFINALKYYYLASITQPNLSDVEDVNSIYFEMFSTMLEQNRYFKNGNSYLEKYTDSSSEVLNLAANGTLLGANELIEENNVIISIFKNVDAEDVSGSELNFELANYHTKQKKVIQKYHWQLLK